VGLQPKICQIADAESNVRRQRGAHNPQPSTRLKYIPETTQITDVRMIGKRRALRCWQREVSTICKRNCWTTETTRTQRSTFANRKRRTKYILYKSLVTNIGVGHFFPGELMTSENHSAPLTYAYLGFTYRSKAEHQSTAAPAGSVRLRAPSRMTDT
jgi:hypothetical protein